MPIPDNFLCPIKYEPMRNPVVTPCGHTFEASAICFWLDDCRHSNKEPACPLCRGVINSNNDLRLDRNLKREIAANPEVIAAWAASAQASAAPSAPQVAPQPDHGRRRRHSRTAPRPAAAGMHDSEFIFELFQAQQLYLLAPQRLTSGYEELLSNPDREQRRTDAARLQQLLQEWIASAQRQQFLEYSLYIIRQIKSLENQQKIININQTLRRSF